MIVAAIAAAGLFWWLGHERRTTTRVSSGPPPPAARSALPTEALDTQPTADLPSGDRQPTTLYAHNLRLRKGPNFRIYVRWIRGLMLRTHPGVNPSFDDPDSFVLDIQKGVVHVNIGDLSTFLNANMPAGAPLSHVSLKPSGDHLQLRGILHKIVPLPVELDGTLSPTPDGRVRFHADKIHVLKIPMKKLMGGVHLQISDLVSGSGVAGVQLSGDDIYFDTQRLTPPPHIHGAITSVSVRPPDLEVIYGGARNDEGRLSQWHNFLKLSEGALDFGKLTMHHTDLTMIDALPGPWFDLDLVNYQAQLVNGYVRVTEKQGLEIYMPNVKVGGQPKKKGDAVTLDWLKNKHLSMPSDVPVP